MVLPVPTPPHMYSPRGGRACMGALRPPKMLCHLRAGPHACSIGCSDQRRTTHCLHQRRAALRDARDGGADLAELGVDGCAGSKHLEQASAQHHACCSSSSRPRVGYWWGRLGVGAPRMLLLLRRADVVRHGQPAAAPPGAAHAERRAQLLVQPLQRQHRVLLARVLPRAPPP